MEFDLPRAHCRLVLLLACKARGASLQLGALRLRGLSPARGMHSHHRTAPVPRCSSALAHEGAELAHADVAGAVAVERDPHRLEGGLGQLLGRELQLVAHEALELDVRHLARAVVVHVLEQLEPRAMVPRVVPRCGDALSLGRLRLALHLAPGRSHLPLQLAHPAVHRSRQPLHLCCRRRLHPRHPLRQLALCRLAHPYRGGTLTLLQTLTPRGRRVHLPFADLIRGRGWGHA